MGPPANHEARFLYTFGKRQYDLTGRTHIMGVLNVTPDSFSDGGKYLSVQAAIDRALEMVEEGADIIDVGGESTRPKGSAYGDGADPVPENEELRRVLPVIEKLTGVTDVPISIDTYKSRVAAEALAAGATIVNDISGFQYDPAMPAVVARTGASAVVMHIKGTPKIMQMNPEYRDLFGEIMESLRRSTAEGERAGVRQMIIDPGIGFGKNQTDNLRLIAGLGRFAALGYPILVGPSRKSFIGNILNLPVDDRVEGTLAGVVACILNGAHLVRVHDVRQVQRVAAVADAIRRTSPPVLS